MAWRGWRYVAIQWEWGGEGVGVAEPEHLGECLESEMLLIIVLVLYEVALGDVEAG